MTFTLVSVAWLDPVVIILGGSTLDLRSPSSAAKVRPELGAGVMYLEEKKRKHSFVIRCGSSENKICVRTCGRYLSGTEKRKYGNPSSGQRGLSLRTGNRVAPGTSGTGFLTASSQGCSWGTGASLSLTLCLTLCPAARA